MQGTLRLMAAEARELRPGGEAVITRLARHPRDPGDPLLARDRSGRADRLARRAAGPADRPRDRAHPPRPGARRGRSPRSPRELAMSRSAFAARFTELVGEPAMQYVARWRMQLALELAARRGRDRRRARGPARLPLRGRLRAGVQARHGHPAGRGQTATRVRRDDIRVRSCACLTAWDNREMSALTADEVAAVEAAADGYLAAMRAGDWGLLAQSFAENAVRIPSHEEPHQGRDAIEAWLSGIEELISYELTRDVVDGVDAFAYIRGRYAITLRPDGRSRADFRPGRLPGDLAKRAGRCLARGRGDLEHAPGPRRLTRSRSCDPDC